jgi:hypothetical protein
LTPSSVVAAADEQVSAHLEGEAVILSLREGVYYGLDAIGAKIWELLQEARTVAELRDAVVGDYDVESGAAEQDVIRLLTEMHELGLVKIEG